MADLDTLRPEVRAAMEAMDADVQTLEWLCIRAELLRLADENKRMRGIIETLDIEGHHRAEKAETELAALKARLADGWLCGVSNDKCSGNFDAAIYCLPSRFRGKRVRLVVEK